MTVVGRHYREWICRTSYSFEYGYVEYKASSLGIMIQPDLIKEYAIRNGQVQELPPESLIMQIIIIIFLQGIRSSSTTVLSAGRWGKRKQLIWVGEREFRERLCKDSSDGAFL